MKEFIFYYDVVCPFAYVASRIIEPLAQRNGAYIRWTPVLLGGLYKENQSQSPMVTSCGAKKKILKEDIIRMFHRYNVPVNRPASAQPVNSLTAMRLLAATPDYSSSNIRQRLTHALFSSLWEEDKDISRLDVLKDVSAAVGWDVDVEDVVQRTGKANLAQNTQEALDNGAFGVPSFVVNGKLFWGVDTMQLMESELAEVNAPPLRLARPPTTPRSATLTIYHDLASPWSFLGSTQIRNFVNELKPMNVKVESVLIVVGSLFKQIGTPVVPMRELSPAKLAYLSKSLQDWCRYHGVQGFRFPSNFPLRTVLPMRVLLANNEPNDTLQDIFYKAAWVEDKDIGNEEVLRGILTNAGYDADELIKKSQSQEIKDQLRKNTDRAVKAGLCGVPSYQVNGGPVLWGQDRLSIIADIICGWNDPIQHEMSKL